MILFRLLDWICRTLSLSHLIVFSYFIFPNKFPKCVSEQVHFLLTSDRSPIRPFKKHHRPRLKKRAVQTVAECMPKIIYCIQT